MFSILSEMVEIQKPGGQAKSRWVGLALKAFSYLIEIIRF